MKPTIPRHCRMLRCEEADRSCAFSCGGPGRAGPARRPSPAPARTRRSPMTEVFTAEAAVARNVRAARKWHGVSQKRLAARLSELGWPLSEGTVRSLGDGKGGHGGG